MKAVPGSEATKLRVVKKLAATDRGAIKLARQFGDSLVCVRHRVDAQAEHRYTTVELLVEKTAIRARVEHVVGVDIGGNERSLQAVVRAAGAKWDYGTRLWLMPRRLAGVLRLTGRIKRQ